MGRKILRKKEKEADKVIDSSEKQISSEDVLEKNFANNQERPSQSEIVRYSEITARMKREVAKAIVGQGKIVDSLIRALICDGHVLLEGVPGIAKTLAIKTLAVVSGCSSKRIQFTVDLLPSDIVGITTYTPGKGFETIKGPIFANFVIADEINRSPSKCVLGDTPVIMENGDIFDIKTIIKRFGGKKIYRENNEYWIVPERPIKLLSFDHIDGRIKAEEVKYLYKQKTSQPFHEVSLKSGRKIKTSNIHPFFTLRDGNITNITASELKEGDCVLVPRRLNIEGTNNLQYNAEFLARSMGIYREIQRRKDLYNKLQQYKAAGEYSKIKELFGEDNKDEQLIRSFMLARPKYLDYKDDYFFFEAGQFGQVHGIRMPKEITKEFAHFMALLIAEGTVKGSYFYMSMKDKNILEYFIKIVRELFDLKINLLYDFRRHIYRIAFRSDSLVGLLKALDYNPHFKSGRKYIPSFILKAKDEIIKEFLSVYYEGDGHISRDCVGLTTKSKALANALSYLLLRIGFVAKISKKMSKTYIGNYSYKRYFYRLNLYGGELNDFYNKINFFSDEKKTKLYNLIKNIRRIKTDLIPGMHNLIRNLRKNNNLSHKEFYIATGMHAHNLENPNNTLMLSRSRLALVANAFETETSFHKLINGDFYCDFVKENRVIIPKKEYWLYDFSMKNTHSFIAGFGGIISHNTQSALIEAMQERQVTLGKETYPLPRPFFVMANQNPLESSGVYTLPEAQIDRFLFKVIMGYPEYDEESRIMEDNITLKKFEEFDIRPISSAAEIIKMQYLAKRIYLDERIRNYILDIVKKTRMKDFKYGELVEWGGSPRASIALFIASKARAMMQGRNFVIPADVKDVAHEVLRHRMILSYRARAEKITSDIIIDEILRNEVGVR